MTWHITARMAWHDRGWDGRVCNDPAGNSYCSGSHSLLSDRLAREKRVECEVPCRPLDQDLPGYQPPCFWTSSAFAPTATKTLHRHPFDKYRDVYQIEDELPPYAIYTWPFRLSITHDSYDQHGQYFPDLNARIARYAGRLQRNRSLIFFYLNYDNPISADDYKYALVGCARLADIGNGGTFAFDNDELNKLRRPKHMKNFPTTNWALKLSHQGPDGAAMLPYHAYLAHIAEHPEDEAKLEEIRVLIEEPALLPRFKYVSEQAHDDHAIALLYKLRRALTRAQAHGIADVDRSLDVLDEIVAERWEDRGLYPGLGSVVSVLADLSEGDVRREGDGGDTLVSALSASLDPGTDLSDAMFALLRGKDTPKALSEHKRVLRNARTGFRDHRSLEPLLRKLSLFTLTPRQVGRILFPKSDGVPAFGSLALSPGDIVANPYLLAESYLPATDDATEERADLDREQRSDGPIDCAVIDIGMFPDQRYLEPHDELHDLTVAGPERLRAFALEALRAAEAAGNSFASATALAEHAAQHPLFYRDKLVVSEAQLLSDDHLAHFRERLHIEVVDGAHYFYRRETWNAEQIVKNFVLGRLELKPLKPDVSWLAAYLAGEAKALDTIIAGFDADRFVAERLRLMSGALTQRFYCATGRPGSGKTKAVARLLAQFDELGESTVVLTPTGKAALRLSQERSEGATWQAQTIDRWIWRSGLGVYVGDDGDLASMVRSEKFQSFDNLVIDEMSMVDLFQLALIFRAIEVQQPTTTKRVILVGDENQLPPIGCGKPFQDILAYIRGDAKRELTYHARLVANCRQRQDVTVLDAAHLFAGRNRYHNDLFDKLCVGGPISDLLSVQYFSNAAELHSSVGEFVERVLDESVPGHRDMLRDEAFNLLLNLYEKGNVRGFKSNTLVLDRAQLLSPYRGGTGGTLGLNSHVRETWRADPMENPWSETDGFLHSDKIVRITNYYAWDRETRSRELRLSNGSIGVLSRTKQRGWQGFFPESPYSIDWDRMDSEDFELAYALTVHKAQGSEFGEVLVVVPERRALLSRELLYTAMTRSKGRLTLLVEKSERANPLRVARDRSVLAQRNSSIFDKPFDAARMFEPEPGVRVQSKIEYMIYTALMRARDAGQLAFAYEAAVDLPFDTRTVTVHPDFTVQIGGTTFYWEHLGLLDQQDYARDWRQRRRAYAAAGLEKMLLTTDDSCGVRADALAAVIADVAAGKLSGRSDLGFSAHHYPL